MSDPVTNAEVEDVLSSIRRLVSEDKRPMPAPKPKAEQKLEPVSDRLVLTPALRVAEEPAAVEPAAPAAQPPAPADDPAVDPAPLVAAEPNPPKQTLAEPEAASAPTNIDDLVSSDTPLDVYGDGPDAPEDLAPLAEETAVPETKIDVEGIEDDYTNDPYNFDDEDDHDGEGTEIVLTTRTEIDENPAEPATDNDAAYGQAAKVSEEEPLPANDPISTGVTEAPPASESALRAEDLPQTTGPVLTDRPERAANADVKSVALSAKIAALETAIGKIADTWEPDDLGESDYAGTEAEEMTWEEAKPTPALPTALFDRQPKMAEEPADAVETPAILHEVEDRSARALEAVNEEIAESEVVQTFAPEAEAQAAAAEEPEAAPHAEHIGAPAAEPEAEGLLATTVSDASPDPAEPAAQELDSAPVAEHAPEADSAPVAEITPAPPAEPAATIDPEPRPEITASPDADAIPDAAIIMPSDEQLLDEDALRDLVSEIVRAELQGALGERITRNVRKLVRREIHRALTAQELE